MGQRHTVTFVDDLDGTEGTPEEIKTVSFSVNGKAYEIDLSDPNAAKLMEALAPFIKCARLVKAAVKAAPAARVMTRTNVPTSGGTDKAYREAARAWLSDPANGYTSEVKERGRIAQHLLDAFETKTPKTPGAPAGGLAQDGLFSEGDGAPAIISADQVKAADAAAASQQTKPAKPVKRLTTGAAK